MNSAVFDEKEEIDIDREGSSASPTPAFRGIRIRVLFLLTMILALGLLIRLVHLDVLPVFCDELLHVSWAKPAAGIQSPPVRLETIYDATWLHGWFLSETIFDATWQHGRFLNVFLLSCLPGAALDSISASRSVSAVLGSSAILALFLAGRRLRDDTAGLIGAGLVAISPFTVMHDRLALADPILSAIAAWIVVLSLDLVLAPRWRWWQTTILAGLLILSVAAKVPGVLLFAYPGLALVIVSRDPKRWFHGCVAVIAAAALVVPALVLFVKKNAFQVAPTKSSSSLLGNLSECVSWVWAYWTPPVVLVAAISAVEGLIRGRREVITLVAWAALPVVVFAVISSGGMLFPRYLLFGVHAGLLLVALASSRVLGQLPRWSEGRRARWPRWFLAAVAICCLWPSVSFALRLISDPPKIELPAIDRGQYIAGLPSGYGSRESAAFLLDHVQRCAGPASVIIPNHFVRRAVEFYLKQDPALKPYVMREKANPPMIKKWSHQLTSAQEGCLFVILAEGAMAHRLRLDARHHGDVIDAGTLVSEFPKPDDRIRLRLYTVPPEYLTGASPAVKSED